MSWRNILVWGLPCILGSTSALSAAPLIIKCQAKYGMFVDCIGDGKVTYLLLASDKAKPLDKVTRYGRCHLWVPRKGTVILDIEITGGKFRVQVVPSEYDEKDENHATFDLVEKEGKTRFVFQGNKMKSHILAMSGPNQYILEPVGDPKPITGRPELSTPEHKEGKAEPGTGS